MRKPRASSNAPMEAAAIPLPSPETTPPVMKMYFVLMRPPGCCRLSDEDRCWFLVAGSWRCHFGAVRLARPYHGQATRNQQRRIQVFVFQGEREVVRRSRWFFL